MSDVIPLASQAHHYLAIFDRGRALALHHTKRLASPAQRIVLYAKTSASYALLVNRQVSRFESCGGGPVCFVAVFPNRRGLTLDVHAQKPKIIQTYGDFGLR
jgi:Domain of unknown function (DUF222)